MKLCRTYDAEGVSDSSVGVWTVQGYPLFVSYGHVWESLCKRGWRIHVYDFNASFTWGKSLHHHTTLCDCTAQQWLLDTGLRNEQLSVHWPTRAQALDALALTLEHTPFPDCSQPGIVCEYDRVVTISAS